MAAERGQQFPEELSMSSRLVGPNRRGHTFLRVTATHPEHGDIGTMAVLHESADPEFADQQGYISGMHVDPDHQRKGVATAMARYATEELGVPLVHSETRTESGDAWAKSWGGPMPPRQDPQ